MKLKNSYLIFFLLLLIPLYGCKDDKITSPQSNAEVVVKVSGTDYNQNSFNTLFPDTASLKYISTAYSNNYSEERRTKLINDMKSKVRALGEDVAVIENILTRAGCNMSGVYILPTYVEKAKYNGKDAWLVQFTYGLSSPDFGHFKCFALSIPDLDTLDYAACK
jgi:hypothetical protein